MNPGQLYNFDLHYMLPGMGSPIEEQQNPYGAKWGNPYALQLVGAQIDGSARDTGNTGNTTVLRAGLLMGKVFATGKLKEWNPDATDGTARIFGILPFSFMVQAGGTDTDKGFAVIVAGSVTAKGICYSGEEYDINGKDEEYNIRKQLAHGNFVFADDPLGALAGKQAGQLVVSADATLGELHNGSLVVVRGATGAVNLTLPASPKRGLEYEVINVSDQDLTLTDPTGNTIVAFNDLTATSVALSTASEKVGGSFRIVGDGTGWLVIPRLWDGQTATIA